MHIAFVFILLMVSSMLAGCDILVKLSSTPEDRINSAIPVSEATKSAKTALLELTKENTTRKEIEHEFSAKLKIRALNCGKGFSPSWFTSETEIRAKLNNTSCFAEADADIARWLNLHRIALVLGSPPLRPIPSPAPAFILGIEFIQSAYFADTAGVALFSTHQNLQIVDIQSSKIIYSERKGSSQPGALSPNGRLFVTGESDRVSVRDSETGAVLAEFGPTRAHLFQWLDNHTAIFTRNDANKTVLIDFATGRETVLQALRGPVQRAVPVPGKPKQFVLFMHQSVAQIELTDQGPETELKLLTEIPLTGSYALNTSGLTADAKRYYSAFNGLTLTSLESLEAESISLEPFRIQTAQATSDPDKILVTGFMQYRHGTSHYFLSISQRTLEQIDRSRLLSERFIYIWPLKKLGVIADSKIAVLGDIPTQEPVTVDKFTEEALEEMIRSKTAAAEQQWERRAAPAMPYAGSGGAIAVAPNAKPIAGPIAELSKNANVEAIGVYQGMVASSIRRNRERTPGVVEVRIKRSNKPLVLVLASYEPVHWKLVPESGARISAILLAGYHTSQVEGAGSVRTVVIGQMYAYKLGTSEYTLLEREVYRWTGKPISVFQGLYEGSKFSVGG